MKRTLGPAGLRFLGIQYRSEKLHEHFMREGIVEMDVRVDERNLGAISARIGKHWLTVYGPPEYHRLHADTWIAAEADLRRRGYRTAEATASIRLAAIDDINKSADAGRKLIGIDDERATAEQLLAAERKILIGADFPDGRDRPITPADDGDLYDGALVVGHAAPSGEPAAMPSATPDTSETHPHSTEPRRNSARKGRWVFQKD